MENPPRLRPNNKSLAARPLSREQLAFFLTIDQRTTIVCLPCPTIRMLLACVHPACYLTRLSPFLVILTTCPYPSDTKNDRIKAVIDELDSQKALNYATAARAHNIDRTTLSRCYNGKTVS
jgi:hypothetical protein